MRVSIRDDGISLAARLVLAGVYLSFGISKLRDIDQTIRSVRAYQLLPETVVPAVGAALPLLEIALGALLLVGLLIRPTAGVVALLSLAFVIGITSAWARGLSIECGCFGNGGYTPNPVPGYLRELAINAVMLAGALWLLVRSSNRFALDSVLRLTRPSPTQPHPVTRANRAVGNTQETSDER